MSGFLQFFLPWDLIVRGKRVGDSFSDRSFLQRPYLCSFNVLSSDAGSYVSPLLIIKHYFLQNSLFLWCLLLPPQYLQLRVWKKQAHFSFQEFLLAYFPQFLQIRQVFYYLRKFTYPSSSLALQLGINGLVVLVVVKCYLVTSE